MLVDDLEMYWVVPWGYTYVYIQLCVRCYIRKFISRCNQVNAARALGMTNSSTQRLSYIVIVRLKTLDSHQYFVYTQGMSVWCRYHLQVPSAVHKPPPFSILDAKFK